jgi:hypothetical protein
MGAIDDADRAEHERSAKQANRETWTLLEREDRTPADDEHMIHAAHASAFHWAVVGGALVSTRADWLLSHVYTVLGHAAPGRMYALRCLATCEREGIGDFDLAYAYEAMARSAAAAHDAKEAKEWRTKAERAGASIADPEDKEIFMGDLVAEPWFGIER